MAERHAWHDRMQAGHIMRIGHGRELTFDGDHGHWGDYAWIMDRTDEALDQVWDRVLTLQRHRRHSEALPPTSGRGQGFLCFRTPWDYAGQHHHVRDRRAVDARR
ncbi:hypothetical protein ACWDE9_30885 [Streptomyces olivaceoviridis]